MKDLLRFLASLSSLQSSCQYRRWYADMLKEEEIDLQEGIAAAVGKKCVHLSSPDAWEGG